MVNVTYDVPYFPAYSAHFFRRFSGLKTGVRTISVQSACNSLISRPIFEIFTVLEMADHALSNAYLFVQIGQEMSELQAAAHIHAVVEPQNAVYCIMFP